jgi:hypothetical protein
MNNTTFKDNDVNIFENEAITYWKEKKIVKRDMTDKRRNLYQRLETLFN